MFKKSLEQKVKKEVEEFFKKTSFEASVEVGEIKEATAPVLIKLEDPQILIGENGQTLFCLQHLLTKVLRKKMKEELYIDLDINDYKKKKIEYLKEMAKNCADDVALSKKEKELRPMPAYERRIIHLELKDRQDVTTESIGQEPERKIIIRPV